MSSLKLAASAALGFVLALGCSAPSSEEGDEAEDGNAAVSTPRDKDNDTGARIAELQRALQNAKPEDFGNAIPGNVKPSIDRLLRMYMHADYDTELRAYSFINGAKKAYVIETRTGKKGAEKRNLYLYEAAGYPSTESKPMKIGKCEAPSLKADALLTCKTHESVMMFDAT